jgi:hypothetical protein
VTVDLRRMTAELRERLARDKAAANRRAVGTLRAASSWCATGSTDCSTPGSPFP